MQVFFVKILRLVLDRLLTSVIVDGLRISAREIKATCKVREAMATLQAYGPARYSRMLQDLKEIRVDVLPGAIGTYEPLERLCLIDERFVAHATPERLAVLLVHEATHARLSSRGITYSDDLRARVEQACIRQEQLFAAKLTNAETIVVELERKLRSRSAHFYSTDAWNRRHLRGWAETLHYLKAPRWMIAFMVKRRRAALAARMHDESRVVR